MLFVLAGGAKPVSALAESALERWLDKRGLAEHLACSVRSIELAITRGLPHAVIFGDERFRASEARAWLKRNRRRRWDRRRPPRKRFGDYGRVLLADPCSYCGAAATQVDHIVPFAAGGTDDWTNYTSACAPCNQSKGMRPAFIWMATR